MNGYIAFTKKEFLENFRNYRLFLMLMLYLLLGILCPLTAKFLPAIVEKSNQLAFVAEDPSALESWTQFYKNISSLGLSLTLILFSNLLSSEYTKGTLVNMLTKGLSRSSVILSKFTVSVVIMSISYWLCYGVTYGYTAYLWPEQELQHLPFAAFALWLNGIMFLCILMLGCVLFRQAFASIIFLFVFTIAFSLLSMTDALASYSPTFLSSKNVDLLSGTISTADFGKPIIISIIVSAVFLILSIVCFNKKQL